ncbi:elongation factor P maturation arginine rhamnosyltransferase EarP [Accumulibacter sp.]|uniref:elongation factor P maturation arginine rhamnosyltransferase EarP n=1 Tax=Accumulibacter sp. TaxID=2053492 RepID=UPI0028C3C226|nr:elongation factor P maturation arginine rhamnosyltransferase EarP [Accumulibacter sp.]
MLSRPFAPSVPPISARPDWDIFCHVIDNFGDIAVCWRLARQLAGERNVRVRLWVDRLETFTLLCAQVDPTLSSQEVQGIEVRRWEIPFPALEPAAVVLETFACRIPEPFVEAMARQSPRPLWINLDYLSAEQWVAGFHALPSPHPRLALDKFFFFPGFTADTGGLLREADLLARRQEFAGSAGLQADFWRQSGLPAPAAGTLLASLFAYENPAIGDLLALWEASAVPVCCMAPLSRTRSAIESYAGRSLRAGDVLRRGALEIRILPFLEEGLYDRLLWLCDLNFVRGEDSFVRAQWAARPLVWHIYPQEEAAHVAKLDAFLGIYCAGLSAAAATALCEFWHAWNGGRVKGGRINGGRVEKAHWQELAAALPTLRKHALQWQKELARQEDLSSRLATFARSKL